MVFGYSWLENIRAEFEVYDTAKDRKWNVEHHNDIINALMMATIVFYERSRVTFRKENTDTILPWWGFKDEFEAELRGIEKRDKNDGDSSTKRMQQFVY
jgi:hypothetical protein